MLYDYRSPKDYQFPHTITRWRKEGEEDMFGRSSYSVETLKCRFQETERTYVNEFGNDVRSRGLLYTAGNDLERGDLVILGEYADEEPVAGAFEIKIKRVHTNQKGTRTEFRYVF